MIAGGHWCAAGVNIVAIGFEGVTLCSSPTGKDPSIGHVSIIPSTYSHESGLTNLADLESLLFPRYLEDILQRWTFHRIGRVGGVGEECMERLARDLFEFRNVQFKFLNIRVLKFMWFHNHS